MSEDTARVDMSMSSCLSRLSVMLSRQAVLELATSEPYIGTVKTMGEKSYV